MSNEVDPARRRLTTALVLTSCIGIVSAVPQNSDFLKDFTQAFNHPKKEYSQKQLIIYESEVRNWQPEKPDFILIAYPWAQTKKVDGRWSYWNDRGHPPNTWINNVMPMFDENGSRRPEDNLYSGSDPKVWEWYLKLAKRAKVPILAFTNWGPENTTNKTLQKIFEFMESSKNPFPLARATAYGEIMATPDKIPTVDEFVDFIDGYKKYAQDSPVAWRDTVDRKLIVPFYTRDEHDTTSLIRLSEAARI